VQPVSSVGRLAPSPTGKLHVGHARTFLLAYWQARSRGGRLVMRLEDLDAPRLVPGAAEGCLRDLTWLGLEWDGPAVVQSEGEARIRAAAERLLLDSRAYPCVCTRGEMREAAGAPHAGDAELRYPGTCRGRFTSVEEAERVTGRQAGVRFLVPGVAVAFVDGLAGPYSVDVAETVGDFLIARKGGSPSYQLAVVVDDAAQGVTEIVRGNDLLPSAARQMLLRYALGLAPPAEWHVPLVRDDAGQRLAKRYDSLSLAELRDRGVDPRALVAWAAKSAGLDTADRVTASEVAPAFDMRRVPTHDVTFGARELEALIATR
jgi:glutamyl-tRNA synthetase